MKKKKLTFIFVIVVILLVGIMVMGCGGQARSIISGNKDGNKNSTKTIVKDISVPILNYRTLNPIASKDEDVFYINKLIFDGLISLNENMEPMPSLAQSWQYEDDGYSLVFTLKSDVYWQDGNTFSAEDVKFTIDALLSGRANQLSVYGDYIANIKSASVQGKNQVTIHFVNNTDVAVENFIFPIVSKAQLKTVAGALDVKNTYSPIGTGQYQVKNIVNNKNILLEPNGAYWGEKAENTITLKVVPTREDGINLIEIHDINVAFTKDMDREKYLENDQIVLTDYISSEMEVVGFNFSSPMMQDKRMRKALAYSIDSANIIKNAYARSGIVSENIYYPEYLGLNKTKNNDITTLNRKKAISLINAIGYIQRDESTALKDSENNEISIRILVNSENKARMEAAELLKAEFNKIPINSTIIVKDWAGYESAIAAGEYDIYIGGFSVLEDMDLRFALHSAYNNPIHYSNPELDVLLDKMQSGITIQEKKETFLPLKEILDDELPYYCLLYKTDAAVGTKLMTGTIVPYFYNRYHGCGKWQYVY